jgi:3-oxoacyl-[acyl-carrier protein] reductase
MDRIYDDAARAELCRRTLLGRLGEMDDVAKVALFLASESSGWITGEVIRATGGVR